MTTRWTEDDVPPQQDRIAVVTGANTGIGWDAARVLAAQRAEVVLACRDSDKARDAAQRIRSDTPGAKLEICELDLASLVSVRKAAGELASAYPRIDLLINNAGLMMPPYGKTEDGFELQFGTNHLGHFALTGLLIDRIREVSGSRIVTVSSGAHQFGKIQFDDLQSEKRYRRGAAYGQSKLANLLFTYELQRRLAAAGSPTLAVAAHPGASKTELSRHFPALLQRISDLFGSFFVQSSAMGALPTLRAATDPDVKPAEYYGPDGFMEMRGHPKRVPSNAASHDAETQRRLWEESEKLSGVSFPV